MSNMDMNNQTNEQEAQKSVKFAAQYQPNDQNHQYNRTQSMPNLSYQQKEDKKENAKNLNKDAQEYKPQNKQQSQFVPQQQPMIYGQTQGYFMPYQYPPQYSVYNQAYIYQYNQQPQYYQQHQYQQPQQQYQQPQQQFQQPQQQFQQYQYQQQQQQQLQPQQIQETIEKETQIQEKQQDSTQLNASSKEFKPQTKNTSQPAPFYPQSFTPIYRNPPPTYIPTQQYPPYSQISQQQKQQQQLNIQAQEFTPFQQAQKNQIQKDEQENQPKIFHQLKNIIRKIVPSNEGQFDTYNIEDFIVKNEILEYKNLSVEKKQVKPQEDQQIQQLKEDDKLSQEDDKSSQEDDKLSQEDRVQYNSLLQEIQNESKLSSSILIKFQKLEICLQQNKNVLQIVKDRKTHFLQANKVLQEQSRDYKKGNQGQKKAYGRGQRQYNGFEMGQYKQLTQEEVEKENIVRAECSEFQKELKDTAQMTTERLKKEKNIAQQIKLVCNQITPDNFDKKFDELRKFIYGDLKLPGEEGYNSQEERKNTDIKEHINELNIQTVVESIFKKAQNERQYCKFYSDLCEKMIVLEMKLMGLKNTMRNMKNVQFRQQLFYHCKKSFDSFVKFDIKKEELEKEEKEQEYIKYKSRLIGNIKFVGELNTKRLLSDSILLSVFGELLKEDNINDDIVEGAIELMTQVGKNIDSKIDRQKQLEEEHTTNIKQKKQETANKYEQYFDRFRELQENSDRISTRIKLLIKNMFVYRDKNWENLNQKQEGPMKVAELRQQIEEKQKHEEELKKREEEEEQNYYYNNRNYGSTQYHKSGKYGNKQYYMARNQGSTQNVDKYEQKNYRKPHYQGGSSHQVYMKKQSSLDMKPLEEISEEDLGKSIIKNFEQYYGKDETESDVIKNFDIFQENQKRFGKEKNEQLFQFFLKAFDQNLKVLEEYFIPYTLDLCSNNIVNDIQIGKTISNYFYVYADVKADYPFLENIISKLIYQLIKNEYMKGSDIQIPQIKWDQEEDSGPDDFYLLYAQILFQVYQNENDLKKVSQFYKNNQFHIELQKELPYVLSKDIFKQIEDEIEDQKAAKFIASLIKGEEQ